jgi:hypothetical protein
MRKKWEKSVIAGLFAGLSVAWAGALFADQLPGQFVSDTPLPEAMRDIKVVEPKRAPRAEQGEATADVWQPRHAGERVEHATGRPEHHFQHGPDNPELRSGVQANKPGPMGIVQPTPGLIIAPRAKPQPQPKPKPGEKNR